MTSQNKIFWGIAISLLLLAAGLRLGSLSNRPVHTDEAVHAEKLGDLLERGEYTYDPHEFHGPTLNYVSHAVARLRGHNTHASLDVIDLRLPAALAGILLVAGVLLLRPIGRHELLGALAVVAVCHELVFFSRYSIQEIFLVCFSLYAAIAIHRTFASPALSSRWLWAVLAGLFVGLAHSTKETWVLCLPAAAIALGVVALRFKLRPSIKNNAATLLGQFALALAVATVVAWALLTNFGKNPAALGDSISTYGNYLRRAAGDAAAMGADRHAHPAWRYIEWLFYSPAKGWLYTELFLLVLAGWSFVTGWRRSKSLSPAQCQWRVGLGVYTVVLFAIYSSLTYKTPWCMLGVILPLCILAGCGKIDLLHKAKRTGQSTHAIATGVILAILAFSTIQAYRASFIDTTAHGNPNVYAHTHDDVAALGKVLERWRLADPAAAHTHIQVIALGKDHWPWPWYLRNFKRVGYHTGIDTTSRPGQLIILMAPFGQIDALEAQLIQHLYNAFPAGQKSLYVAPNLPGLPKRMRLRLDIEMRLYVPLALRERMHEALAPAKK